MSGSEKSIRPIRQLSLQPPAPRRQQVRRQRSAEDEKSLQICASPFARGKRGTCKGSERPKVSFTTATFSKILISYSIILARCIFFFQRVTERKFEESSIRFRDSQSMTRWPMNFRFALPGGKRGKRMKRNWGKSRWWLAKFQDDRNLPVEDRGGSRNRFFTLDWN